MKEGGKSLATLRKRDATYLLTFRVLCASITTHKITVHYLTTCLLPMLPLSNHSTPSHATSTWHLLPSLLPLLPTLWNACPVLPGGKKKKGGTFFLSPLSSSAAYPLWRMEGRKEEKKKRRKRRRRGRSHIFYLLLYLPVLPACLLCSCGITTWRRKRRRKMYLLSSATPVPTHDFICLLPVHGEEGGRSCCPLLPGLCFLLPACH